MTTDEPTFREQLLSALEEDDDATSEGTLWTGRSAAHPRHYSPIEAENRLDAFERLPQELLPEILGHLRWRQGELAQCALVCREWYRAATPMIWEWVRSRDAYRIVQAFRSLSTSPRLASYLRSLEVRVFPLSTTSSDEIESLHLQILETLKLAQNLRSLVWTRKGSLTHETMEAICALTKLEKLELNATPAGEWEAKQLLRLPTSLQSLILLLPDREVLQDALPAWLDSRARGAKDASGDNLEGQAPSLQSLSIICLESPILKSSSFASLYSSSQLASLTSFTLHGCTRLSDADILSLLQTCASSLTHLALEAVSISVEFYTSLAGKVPRLESLRTSHPGKKKRDEEVAAYYAGLGALVQRCPRFRSFTHYLSGDTSRGLHPAVSPHFMAQLLETNPALERFEISGLSMSLDCVFALCLRSSVQQNLTALVVPVAADYFQTFADECLSGLKVLRSLHVVSPSTMNMKIGLGRMLELVKGAGESLKQVGVQNRVRSVQRRALRPFERYDVNPEDDDPMRPSFVDNGMRVSLQAWDEPLGVWPEALLVVRT